MIRRGGGKLINNTYKNISELRYPEYHDEWREIKIKKILKESHIPSEDNLNKHLTVKLNLKGIIKRTPKPVEKEGVTKQYYRKKGQFIYGKQNLYNGSFRIILDELDGFLSSTDIPSFDFYK